MPHCILIKTSATPSTKAHDDFSINKYSLKETIDQSQHTLCLALEKRVRTIFSRTEEIDRSNLLARITDMLIEALDGASISCPETACSECAEDKNPFASSMEESHASKSERAIAAVVFAPITLNCMRVSSST